MYTSADNSTEYGPSTPASRSSDNALADHIGHLADIIGQAQHRIRRGLSDPLDAGRPVPLEDRTVLDERELLGRVLDRVPVGVLRTALDVVDVSALEGERDTQPHKRFALPQVGHHTAGGRLHVGQMTGADGRGHGPAGIADVDHATTGDVPLEGSGSFQFDFRPRQLR